MEEAKDKKDILINVENVSKHFKIYHEKTSSIKDIFLYFGRKGKYEKFDALKNISFQVKRGEFVGIVGRNGSGKSTLLKLLAGVYVPNEGKIEINGRLIPFLELGVGFNPELTARENIFLNGTILGLTVKELTTKFDEIVDFAEIREFIDMPLKTFSSGMQVRLAFSVAIQADADIYLLDEILAVGDANFQAKSMAQFRKFKEQGKTVILVTHDLSAVQQYCEKAIYIKNHAINSIGKPQKILGKYIYEDRDKERGHSRNEKNWTQENSFIEIENVRFLDKENTENAIFFTKDPLTIKVTYKVKQKLNAPTFGIAIYKEDGTQILGDNTFLSKAFDHESIDSGTYEVSYKVDKLNVLSGNFLVTLAVTDNTFQKTYIWVEKKYPFSIISTGTQNGLVLLDTQWTVEHL
jgi:lipopolysaccharide transport system ATP-binding protein